MADIVSFPSRKTAKPKPDSVRLGYDFNRWCVEFFAGDRLLRRSPCDSRLEASQLVESLAQHQNLRRLPDGGAA